MLDGIPLVAAFHAESGVVSFGDVDSCNDVPWESGLHVQVLGSGVWPQASLCHKLTLIVVTVGVITVCEEELSSLVILVGRVHGMVDVELWHVWVSTGIQGGVVEWVEANILEVQINIGIP